MATFSPAFFKIFFMIVKFSLEPPPPFHPASEPMEHLPFFKHNKAKHEGYVISEYAVKKAQATISFQNV